MIQVQNRSFTGLGVLHPQSRTMACPGATQTVSRLRGEADASRLSIARFGNAGGDFFSSVPTWAWVAGGGLVVGVVAGVLLFKKRKG